MLSGETGRKKTKGRYGRTNVYYSIEIPFLQLEQFNFSSQNVGGAESGWVKGKEKNLFRFFGRIRWNENFRGIEFIK